MDETETLGADKLRGVPEIADFLGENRKVVYDWLENGYLPAGKLGNVWLASKRRLRERYEEITNPPPRERPQKEEKAANGLAPPCRGRPRKNPR
jgi:hypothetical protein